MKILGIDPSSRSTGVVMLGVSTDAPDEVLDTAVLKKAGTHDWDRVCRIRDEVGGFCEPLVLDSGWEHWVGDVNLAVIEGYALSAGSRQSSSVTKLVEIGTAIRIVLDRLFVPWIIVTPSQLKKFVGAKAKKVGSRAARNKLPVRQAVERHWGFTDKSDDIVDAYALAQVGASVLLKKHYKTTAQIEVAVALRPALRNLVMPLV